MTPGGRSPSRRFRPGPPPMRRPTPTRRPSGSCRPRPTPRRRGPVPGIGRRAIQGRLRCRLPAAASSRRPMRRWRVLRVPDGRRGPMPDRHRRGPTRSGWRGPRHHLPPGHRLQPSNPGRSTRERPRRGPSTLVPWTPVPPNRGPSNRGPSNRGPSNRGPPNRGPPNRGQPNRRPSIGGLSNRGLPNRRRSCHPRPTPSRPTRPRATRPRPIRPRSSSPSSRPRSRRPGPWPRTGRPRSSGPHLRPTLSRHPPRNRWWSPSRPEGDADCARPDPGAGGPPHPIARPSSASTRWRGSGGP